MKAEHSLKIKRFLEQYKNKGVWQVEDNIKALIEEIRRETINDELQALTNVCCARRR